MNDNIEDAEIVIDLSGGKLLIAKLRSRVEQFQSQLADAKMENEKLRKDMKDAGLMTEEEYNTWKER